MTAAALTVPPKHGHPTFLFSELAPDLDNLQADIAFLGIPYGSAYSFEDIYQRPEPHADGDAPGERPHRAQPRAL